MSATPSLSGLWLQSVVHSLVVSLGMWHSSTYACPPNVQVQHIRDEFKKDFPHVSTASNKCWNEKTFPRVSKASDKHCDEKDFPRVSVASDKNGVRRPGYEGYSRSTYALGMRL